MSMVPCRHCLHIFSANAQFIGLAASINVFQVGEGS